VNHFPDTICIFFVRLELFTGSYFHLEHERSQKRARLKRI